MPPHAPYEVVEGEPVEVRVFRHPDEPDTLVAECEFQGDTFGGTTSIAGSDLEQKLAADELVTSVAMLVWNQLFGTPVFREEDQEWVERVDARAPWTRNARRPTEGWVRGHEAEPPTGPAPVHTNGGDPLRESLGDADVSALTLSQDEMAALVRGEIPDVLVGKLLQARSTENLLDSVAEVLDVAAKGDVDYVALQRARRELIEVRRRFGLV